MNRQGRPGRSSSTAPDPCRVTGDRGGFQIAQGRAESEPEIPRTRFPVV